VSAPFAGQVAVVTGASRGIGAAISKRLAADGAHVVLTARTEGGLMETEDAIHAAGGKATIAPVDLARGDDIDRLAGAIGQRWPEGIHLLVLNAATLGSLTPIGHASPKEFESVMALNVTAQWRLIRAFDPLLRRSRGTVVAVTSSVGTRPTAYWGPYAASKAALEMLVATYAEEMKSLHVKALILDPGGTRTSMRARAFPGEDPGTLKPPEAVADRLAERLAGGLSPGLSRLAVARDGSLAAA
jgi:NAD(P)-dependent dehydrogenase (short-subunit alcohol dehydrogenase family)